MNFQIMNAYKFIQNHKGRIRLAYLEVGWKITCFMTKYLTKLSLCG
jgi:hypothetical protein